MTLLHNGVWPERILHPRGTYEGREGANGTTDAKFMSTWFIPYKGEEGREQDSVVFWTIRLVVNPSGSLPSYDAEWRNNPLLLDEKEVRIKDSPTSRVNVALRKRGPKVFTNRTEMSPLAVYSQVHVAG